ncbi:hypothetical protein [Hypericibacter terrae]|jgi:hypothetical protein|uniref:hypothetical protein n=1 Tax=Hypericibacter terrae TaxID=2602015 RepID=UPI001787422A|nr:hypothetical protein [Hypericibacter terrae]
MLVAIGFSRCLTLLFWEGMRGRRFGVATGRFGESRMFDVDYFGPVSRAQLLSV